MSGSRRRKSSPRSKRNPLLGLSKNFLAIDFETADYERDSACAVGLVKVIEGEIVRTTVRLIKPPRPRIHFTYIHGITWEHVKDQPTFAEVWESLAEELIGVDYFVAHNAGFDQTILRGCCSASGLKMPTLPFECTVRIARSVWGLHPTRLPDCCQFLNIPLKHHDAGSDAEACAKILLAAMQTVREQEKPNTPSLF